jgi:hypothetical protein
MYQIVGLDDENAREDSELRRIASDAGNVAGNIAGNVHVPSVDPHSTQTIGLTTSLNIHPNAATMTPTDRDVDSDRTHTCWQRTVGHWTRLQWVLFVVLFTFGIALAIGPGLECRQVYMADASCDRYATSTQGWVSNVTLVPTQCCGDDNCWTCYNIAEMLMYNTSNGSVVTTVACNDPVSFPFARILYPTNVDVEQLAADQLGQVVSVAYNLDNPRQCFLDHCRRSCDGWQYAFLIPSIFVLCCWSCAVHRLRPKD